MPRESFDDVARTVAGFGSRRALLRLLAAGLGPGWSSVSHAVAAAPKRRCQRIATACSKRKTCCPGTRCVRGRCRCPATKKPCGRACIAPTACCPAKEEPCAGQCVPIGTCCTAQQQRCGSRCIPRTACCTNQDCTGPCDTGVCQANNSCGLKAVESPCEAEVIGHCDASGACIAAACSDGEPCREPEHPCRYASCVDNRCLAKEHASGHELPDDAPGDCHQRICDPTAASGISRTFDDNDFPPHPGPCTESLCASGFPITRPRHEGFECDKARGWVCDENQMCGPPEGRS